MNRRAWLLTGIIVVALLECLGWFFGASILWATRNLLVAPSSAEAANRTHWALVVFAAAALNSIALLFFLIRRGGWGWLVLTTVQVVDLVLTAIAIVAVEAHWGLFSAAAAAMVILLFLFRRSEASRGLSAVPI